MNSPRKKTGDGPKAEGGDVGDEAGKSDFSNSGGVASARISKGKLRLTAAGLNSFPFRGANQEDQSRSAARAPAQTRIERFHRGGPAANREQAAEHSAAEAVVSLNSPPRRLPAFRLSYMRMISRLRRLLRGEKTNPLFDRDWYLSQYPDVRDGAIDPYDHFLRYGAAEGRDPSPTFDTQWYLKENADVRESGINPLVHFYRHGAAEGRDPRPPSAQTRKMTSNWPGNFRSRPRNYLCRASGHLCPMSDRLRQLRRRPRSSQREKEAAVVQLILPKSLMRNFICLTIRTLLRQRLIPLSTISSKDGRKVATLPVVFYAPLFKSKPGRRRGEGQSFLALCRVRTQGRARAKTENKRTARAS